MKLSENAKATVIFLIVSLIAMFYFGGVVTPYGSSHNFMGDGSIPEKQFVPVYVLLTLPAYIAYIIYSCLNIKKLRPRFFIYPFICFNFYVGLIYSLMALGGVIMWLLVFTAIPLFIVMLICLIVGIILDIFEWKKNKTVLMQNK